MKFLFCCEFYYPSVGGVQEVMKQIADLLSLTVEDCVVFFEMLDEMGFENLDKLLNRYSEIRVPDAHAINGNLKFHMFFFAVDMENNILKYRLIIII